MRELSPRAERQGKKNSAKKEAKVEKQEATLTKRPKQKLNSDVASYHGLVSQDKTVRAVNNKALEVEPLWDFVAHSK